MIIYEFKHEKWHKMRELHRGRIPPPKNKIKFIEGFFWLVSKRLDEKDPPISFLLFVKEAIVLCV